MQKLFLLLTLLIIAVSSFSQTISASDKTKDYYLTKSKHQKTAAWIMLGGGAALTGVGVAVAQAGRCYN